MKIAILPNLLSKIDEKYKYYFFAGVLLLVFCLDYLVIMKPQLSNLNTLNPKISVLNQDISKLKENQANVSAYRNDIERLKAQLANLEQKIKTKEELPLILDVISRLAHNANVKIDQIMPVKAAQEVALTVGKEKYYRLPVFLKARASYHDFGRFVDELESADIYFEVRSFTLEAQEKNLHQHAAEMTIQVIILDKT